MAITYGVRFPGRPARRRGHVGENDRVAYDDSPPAERTRPGPPDRSDPPESVTRRGHHGKPEPEQGQHPRPERLAPLFDRHQLFFSNS